MIDISDDYVKGCLWESLENRKTKIGSYHDHMDHVCGLLPQYVTNVKFAIRNGKSRSMVSHLTYNLVFDLMSSLNILYEHEMLSSHYLLADDYDYDYKKWNDFRLSAIEIKKIIEDLEKENYFNESDDEDIMDDLYLYYLKHNKPIRSHLNLEREVSIFNGNGLLKLLRYYLEIIEDWLEVIKLCQYKIDNRGFDIIYNANYDLYRKDYWPSEGANFRKHIEKHYFRGKSSKIEILEARLTDEQEDFEKCSVGELWRDYIDDKKTLYFEMKKAKLDENQWRYFFKSISRFEEYKRWIDELKHPNLAGKEYPSSCWDKIFKDAIDIKKVKLAISNLLPPKISIANWFIIYKIFCEINWLQDTTATNFIHWVKDVYGWNFRTEDFKSSVNSELKRQHTLDWDARIMTSAKKAKEYIDFANTVRKEFTHEMDGKVVREDNKYYFKNPDLYIDHTHKL